MLKLSTTASLQQNEMAIAHCKKRESMVVFRLFEKLKIFK